MHGVQLYGLTCPLLTKSDGSKMGKTESGAGLALGRADQPLPVLPVLDQRRRRRRGQVPAVSHRAVARGDRGARRGARGRPAQARQPAAAGRGADATGPRRRRAGGRAAGDGDLLRRGDQRAVATANSARSLPTCPARSCRAAGSPATGCTIVDALVEAGLAKSKSDARRTIEQGGAYVNNRRIDSIEYRCTAARSGQRNGDGAAQRKEEICAGAVCSVTPRSDPRPSSA